MTSNVNLLAFALAFIGCVLATPLVTRVAIWAGAIDRPDQFRRIHKAPCPEWGPGSRVWPGAQHIARGDGWLLAENGEASPNGVSPVVDHLRGGDRPWESGSSTTLGACGLG